MKSHPLLITGLVMLMVVTTVQADPKNGQKKYVPAPPQQPLATDALPSTVLQPFLDDRLNKILAPLDQPGLKHPDAIADLRSAIADGMAKASPVKQPAFRAALAVCDTLQHAYDERSQAIGNFQGAGVTSSSDKLGVSSRGDTNAFFGNAHKSQWIQRAAQWRQAIQQSYLRERETERQVSAPAPLSPSAPSPAT